MIMKMIIAISATTIMKIMIAMITMPIITDYDDGSNDYEMRIITMIIKQYKMKKNILLIMIILKK